MDRQPIYVETEIIVEGATVRYVYMLLPVFSAEKSIEHVHIVTRPALGTMAVLARIIHGTA